MVKGIQLFVLDKIVLDYRGRRSHSDSITGLGMSVYAEDEALMDTYSSKLRYQLAISGV